MLNPDLSVNRRFSLSWLLPRTLWEDRGTHPKVSVLGPVGSSSSWRVAGHLCCWLPRDLLSHNMPSGLRACAYMSLSGDPAKESGIYIVVIAHSIAGSVMRILGNSLLECGSGTHISRIVDHKSPPKALGVSGKMSLLVSLFRPLCQ